MRIGFLLVLTGMMTGGSFWKDFSEKPGMRETMFRMEAEARILRKFIESKQSLPVFQDSIPDMRHTVPTDPDEITEGYKVMAGENIRLRKEVFQARNPKPVFNRYIASCIKCHESHCPGPINRISKLKLD
jgi:hypothetical protein